MGNIFGFADEIVLGPKWMLMRLRLQETRVEFTRGAAVLTGPALSFRAIRNELECALAQALAPSIHGKQTT